MLLVTWAIHGFRDKECEGRIVGYISMNDHAHAVIIPTGSAKLVDIPIRDLVVVKDANKRELRKRAKKTYKQHVEEKRDAMDSAPSSGIYEGSKQQTETKSVGKDRKSAVE